MMNSVQTTKSSTGGGMCNGAGKRYQTLQSLGVCGPCPLASPCQNPCQQQMRPGPRPAPRPVLKEEYRRFVKPGTGGDAGKFVQANWASGDCGAWMDTTNCDM